MLKRVGDRRHPCLTPAVVLNHSPMLPFIWTALVALSYSYSMVRTRFALVLYFCMVAHKSGCYTLSKTFLKSMKTWNRFCCCRRYSIQGSEVEDMFCGASSGSKPSLFFSKYFFSLGFKPIQDNFQHHFAGMTDETDSSIVLEELQVALFRVCNNHGVGHSPVLQILLQISVKTFIMVSPPACTSSAGILSTPADFPFFSDTTAISTSSRRIGRRSASGGWLQPRQHCLNNSHTCTVLSNILSIC